VQIVKRSDAVKGWVLLPRRWVVERTFGWLSQCRALARDDEYHPKTSEALIQVAMVHLMLRRLARKAITLTSAQPLANCNGI